MSSSGSIFRCHRFSVAEASHFPLCNSLTCYRCYLQLQTFIMLQAHFIFAVSCLHLPMQMAEEAAWPVFCFICVSFIVAICKIWPDFFFMSVFPQSPLVWSEYRKLLVHPVRCEDILALRAGFTCCWCLAVCPCNPTLSHPHLMCLVTPKAVVLVRAAVNRLHTVSTVFRLTSVGPEGCVQSQFSVQPCELSCCQIQLSWSPWPMVTPPIIQGLAPDKLYWHWF